MTLRIKKKLPQKHQIPQNSPTSTIAKRANTETRFRSRQLEVVRVRRSVIEIAIAIRIFLQATLLQHILRTANEISANSRAFFLRSSPFSYSGFVAIQFHLGRIYDKKPFPTQLQAEINFAKHLWHVFAHSTNFIVDLSFCHHARRRNRRHVLLSIVQRKISPIITWQPFMHGTLTV